MSFSKLLWFLLCASAFTDLARGESNIRWSLVLEQPHQQGIEVCHFDGFPEHALAFKKTVGGIQLDVEIEPQDNLVKITAKAQSETEKTCFLSLRADFKKGTPWSYKGEVIGRQIFRQSPHDPANYNFSGLTRQDLPMIAIRDDSGFMVAVSDTPGVYDNFTTQTMDSQTHTALLSSGDDGEITGHPPQSVKIQQYYHAIGNGNAHIFNAILFKSNASTLNDLRKDVLFAIARRWGANETGRFGATAFSSNYTLVRSNETCNSRYWVVPGIDYSNKQYSRDAFWQSMVLPPHFARECYQNEAVAQTPGAERPLFCMIWAYRTKLEGGQPDMEAARKTLQYIEAHTQDGWYHSSNVDGKKDFQSWCDLAAFEKDDVITYNQGLLAVALLSAEALGLKPSVSSAQAIKNYQAMFDKKAGYFPFSQKKNLLAVDPLVGDLLAQLFFHQALLSDESVRSHFEQVIAHAKTPYGFKVTCLPDGSYAPASAYSARDFSVQSQPTGGQWQNPGSYQWGASWYLYDMLFLIDAYLHGAPGAEKELVWRGALDFKLGGTYFETINTATGQLGRANQGWDAAVYAIWKKLMEQGRVNSSLLDAVDKVTSN
ncbi:MAG TPA: hypothetical protein VMH87_02180 [Pseudomonadales bacterium]|nr:hypothetical protein [Pseudomonadales bacterium]